MRLLLLVCLFVLKKKGPYAKTEARAALPFRLLFSGRIHAHRSLEQLWASAQESGFWHRGRKGFSGPPSVIQGPCCLQFSERACYQTESACRTRLWAALGFEPDTLYTKCYVIHVKAAPFT